MKPTTTTIITFATLIVATTLAFRADREAMGVAILAIGMIPILALIASKPLSRPWFMEGVDWTPPSTTLSCFLAVLSDAWAAFLVIDGTSGWVIITTRLALALAQLAIIGKFTTDTEKHATSEKSDQVRRPRNSRES